MIKRSVKSILTTWLAGLLALLPLAMTLALIGWVVSVLNSFIGPESLIGQMFGALGQPFASNDVIAYLLGTLLLLVAIYPLGLAVQSGLKRPLAKLVDLTLRRIPLFGSLYNLADRFVGLLDQKQEADIGAMSPVWCFFGGDGVAVLALMPSPEPVDLDGRLYYAVLVPTAPVPIGGGLLYVPADWVRPANIGVDKLTSVYVSMGITPPPALRSGKVVLGGAAPTILG
ncbi:hypothetical protein JHS3_30010 [Jeongeupia sp. HS-3]|uniref:DUF502 domain-containing protein n=1 Tax=Jeongeupia sp. HS-3 TaxID=1009682 RepID=UPI0018A66E4A|nr:DUF502 domain-containing protein [Jeongeupia sp. HS-3]BCL77265.1 hypothetical protein JHS3_30010 [Jeongeupia sp. HS-3]